MRSFDTGRSESKSKRRIASRVTSPLGAVISDAAARTCATIAASSRRPADDIRRQVDEAVDWLTDDASPNGGPPARSAPPNVAREYVDMLRGAIVARLSDDDVAGRVDAVAVIRLFDRLEALGAAWKQTDRGRFMSRLTGADSADAVVAIAHDIRSPLTSILILVDSLRRGMHGKADPARDRQLGIIYGAAQGLSTLASDLIDAARGERVAIGQVTAFSVTETMSAVGDILRPVCEERSLPLHLSPPLVDGRIGYPGALQRVLLNLASNALRCTERGFVSIGCTEPTPTTVAFSVTDSGPGVPPDVLAQLFDGFSDDRTSVRFSRTGLGLAIVRMLLDAMGATLEVETAPGQGATFSFELELPRAR